MKQENSSEKNKYRKYFNHVKQKALEKVHTVHLILEL